MEAGVWSLRFAEFLLSLVLFLPGSSFAQVGTKRATGIVVGEDDKALPGATITNLRTKAGTNSDVDGAFSINAESGDQLEASYIGMISQTITYSGQANVKFSLKADEKGKLDEVLVVSTGYNTMDRKLFTGSSTTISAKDALRNGIPDVSRMLEGQVAGVSVQNVSGTFGAAPKIRIRGLPHYRVITNLFGW
ncbi:carboxypeptidase-like regulatory domain-containing protein [Niabella hibiscisoli]|uniref:carboxypeptidase-like regulatory domain-containing protein n=1 Tax=Niabella hibiscisoli TaxID=1825928 RepID=UPI001F103645|nr:carboxypeptidase-like regulatory domain-containing protein [Niabella hibiscisoli]MCH5715952.1 carboxypeptidase-like regulatory domain-containing protein [Niabella hibiscisoli]